MKFPVLCLSQGYTYLVEGVGSGVVGAVVVVFAGREDVCGWDTGAVEAGGVGVISSRKAKSATIAIMPAMRAAPMTKRMALPAPSPRARASGLLL